MSTIIEKLTKQYLPANRYDNFGSVLLGLNIRGIKGTNCSLTFDFPVTAIAGFNGAGKSTIAQIALCMYRSLDGDEHNRRKYLKDFFVKTLLDKTPYDKDATIEAIYADRLRNDGEQLSIFSHDNTIGKTRTIKVYYSMVILMIGGLFVMMFSAAIIGIAYLSLNNQKGEYAGKEHIFMPIDEKRNIRKPLRDLCAGIGGTLILVAVIVFLIGGIDSIGNGELSSMTCNRCSGSGRTWSGEKCPTCDGFGQILHNENGRNIMGTPALWVGIIGIGLVVVGARLKEESYQTNEIEDGDSYTNQKTNNDELAPSISSISDRIDGDKWICGHCGILNSLNYGQCKKCGKYKS